MSPMKICLLLLFAWSGIETVCLPVQSSKFRSTHHASNDRPHKAKFSCRVVVQDVVGGGMTSSRTHSECFDTVPVSDHH